MNTLKVISLGPSLLQQGGMAAVENIILRYAPSDVSIKHISTHEEGSGVQKIKVFAQGLLNLISKLLRGRADLLHVHFSERACVYRTLAIMAIASIFRRPVVLHAHGSEFREFYAKLSAPVQGLVRFMLGQCSRFVVLSESWKDYYQHTLKLTDKQVVVLANPIELPPAIPNREQSHPVKIVFLGRIGQRKGTFDLIQAFAAMTREQKAKARLILAGDGEEDAARKLIKSLDLAGVTSLLGWIDSAKRNEILQSADIFVLPSYNEGLPMAMLEAMSWGLPAIVTPVGGIPEVIEHGRNGLLVNPGDVERLTQGLQQLIEDETYRLELGKQARDSVTPLAIENYWENLRNLYDSMLPQSKGAIAPPLNTVPLTK
ncbi:glycosyltransferase family 4 protein [Desertifilum sp. FACHB-1129]|uniref:Glycosyl transferase family 1 n=1 Tax=Desertifilum tharense IPPAS B-1220 TaxID=1781255 RepID=A0A1E5QMZ4_9CYAN|nr:MULTISPECIES: glycosyltransferase family 4 protein [Desertifilum]MDA0213064.1 glycosyltransferase family 4 protein [Cyanobacteria bacterium FC1]MBD2312370.1 glycosyltransferase family 4 protein [Desertifilum sp. FACHB-1129]MBD2321153.1 glycosyltransferase family 4 protein [Desertifilum sp. FACHB-866]MBD2331540.1 glycosyltransferase family 4 protein [Desertifilum sp. FACHB-868]OEJ76052.1 hypothetical protein BH720_05700 [Desertifilum tharense IPPAS B-1220]